MPRINPAIAFEPICPDGIDRVCRICGTTKPLIQFTKNKQRKDGWATECLACAKIRTSGYRAANLEKVRAHDRERSKTPERLAELRGLVAKYKISNPEKARAHWMVKDAIRAGKLKRLPCIICGETRSTGHHEDYSKPLEVIWLCYAHHKQLHAGRITLP